MEIFGARAENLDGQATRFWNGWAAPIHLYLEISCRKTRAAFQALEAGNTMRSLGTSLQAATGADAAAKQGEGLQPLPEALP